GIAGLSGRPNAAGLTGQADLASTIRAKAFPAAGLRHTPLPLVIAEESVVIVGAGRGPWGAFADAFSVETEMRAGVTRYPLPLVIARYRLEAIAMSGPGLAFTRTSPI